MNICGQMCEKLKQILLNIDHDLFDLLCDFREGPVAGRTNRARVYITSEAARLFLDLTRRPPLGAAIALAQDSFDRDKTR